MTNCRHTLGLPIIEAWDGGPLRTVAHFPPGHMLPNGLDLARRIIFSDTRNQRAVSLEYKVGILRKRAINQQSGITLSSHGRSLFQSLQSRLSLKQYGSSLLYRSVSSNILFMTANMSTYRLVLVLSHTHTVVSHVEGVCKGFCPALPKCNQLNGLRLNACLCYNVLGRCY
jgi:hypothetical protein